VIAKSPVPVVSAVGHEIDITIADLIADVRAATPSNAAEIVVREKAELLQDLAELKAKMAFALLNRVEFHAREIDQMQTDLARFFQIKFDNAVSETGALAGKLDALSPLKVLDRGYSITYKLPSMNTVKDSKELKRGDKVLIAFNSGKARCSVTETED
jgi:exodeoxyribonuclease VII large subunit